MLGLHRRGRNSFPLVCPFIYFLSTLTSSKRVLSEIIHWALTFVLAGPKTPVISLAHTPPPQPSPQQGSREVSCLAFVRFACTFSLDRKHYPLPVQPFVRCRHSLPAPPPSTSTPETLWSCQRSRGCRRRAAFAHQPPHGWLGAPGLHRWSTFLCPFT